MKLTESAHNLAEQDKERFDQTIGDVMKIYKELLNYIHCSLYNEIFWEVEREDKIQDNNKRKQFINAIDEIIEKLNQVNYGKDKDEIEDNAKQIAEKLRKSYDFLPDDPVHGGIFENSSLLGHFVKYSAHYISAINQYDDVENGLALDVQPLFHKMEQIAFPNHHQ